MNIAAVFIAYFGIKETQIHPDTGAWRGQYSCTCSNKNKHILKEFVLFYYMVFGLNIFYFIYMKRDWAEHGCYVEALSQVFLLKNCIILQYLEVLNLWPR